MPRPAHRLLRALRRARQSRQLSTPRLAALAGVSGCRIRDLETGRATAPILNLLDAISRPMGMALFWRHSKLSEPHPQYDRLTRDACAEAMCHGCAQVLPVEQRSGQWVHVLPRDQGVSFPCRAAAIFEKVSEV